MISSARLPKFRRPLRRRASLWLLALVALLPGCAARPAKKTSASASATPPAYAAPVNLSLGRVISFDSAAGVALVEFHPLAKIPSDLPGHALVARNPDTLKITAHLVASGRRAGAILGVYVIDGAPSPQDEVVQPPFAP